MMRRVCLRLAVCVLLLAAPARAVNCVASAPGVDSLDLAQFQSNSRDFTIQEVDYPAFEWVVNVCRALIWNDGVCPAGACVCERLKQGAQGSDNYGNLNTAVVTRTSIGAKIVYTAGACQRTAGKIFTSTINIVCDSSIDPVRYPDGQMTVVDEDYFNCATSFELRKGCVFTPRTGDDDDAEENKGTVSSETDVGMVLCIVFFVGLFVYFAAGFAYLHHRGNTGVDRIPNLEFWKSLPGLIKDGSIYSWGKTCEFYAYLREKWANRNGGTYTPVK